MCVHSSITQFAGSVSHLVNLEVGHKFYNQPANEELYYNSLMDAAEALNELQDMGQINMIGACMEGIETATWYMTPEQDYQVHSLFIQKIYSMVVEVSKPDEGEDGAEDDDSPVDFIPDDVYGDVDPEQLEHLKKCFNLQHSM